LDKTTTQGKRSGTPDIIKKGKLIHYKNTAMNELEELSRIVNNYADGKLKSINDKVKNWERLYSEIMEGLNDSQTISIDKLDLWLTDIQGFILEGSSGYVDYDFIDSKFDKLRLSIIDSYKEKFKECTTRILELKGKIIHDKIASDKSLDNLIDLSDTKTTEKIIYLYELGIFDFLLAKQPFRSSKNALASVLGAITGINPRTIQSYINPINNPDPEVDQTNNPLKRENKVQIIRDKLRSLGFSVENK